MCKAHTYVIAFNCHTNTFIYRQERQALEEKALAQGPTQNAVRHRGSGPKLPELGPALSSSVQLGRRQLHVRGRVPSLTCETGGTNGACVADLLEG